MYSIQFSFVYFPHRNSAPVCQRTKIKAIFIRPKFNTPWKFERDPKDLEHRFYHYW